jgi:cytosine/adenosine deaminase-related metal-dependent hydrolase
MRLYTADTLLTGASAEVIRRGGVLTDGGQIVAAGPSEALQSMGPARRSSTSAR